MPLFRKASATVLLAAALGGCQALGGGAGVMPESDVGPPPSMRGAVPNAAGPRSAGVDADGNTIQTTPTRRLDLPRSAGGTTRAAASEERRIRREDLEGSSEGRSSSGGGMTPSLGSGGVGVGGKF
ncbi:MAG: hypothetical protein Q7T93_11685 [Methylobacterium sp.]|uniref:hypothetical protein n=1 Tax=unclassified Methylobacterium TaxID=2615210 RepID=UPI000700AE5A|nr:MULTISPECIES: hypothetical protein [unclassified Methylobacterium]KQP10460.1 hypothetical protein ASF28_04850 [Methylobacterium sp. Leaf99]MDO9427480.1 hypothetical protein [Methylobacterium sp.]TXM70214.1 hypothetical protein FV218_16395 [Methylobacterium sp. WL69]